MVLDGDNNILYYNEGYKIGIGEEILKIVDK